MIYRAKELQQVTGLSRSTIWRMEREGSFPQRLKISTGCVGWRKSEIDEWVKGRQQVAVQENTKGGHHD